MRKNKLFRTIAALTLGLTMTIGVSAGIVASRKETRAVYATTSGVTATYNLVESDQADWSGTYIIYSTQSNKLWDASSSVSANGTYVSITPNNKKISTDTSYEWTIEKIANSNPVTYSIKSQSNSNPYIKGGTSSGKVTTNEEPQPHTISWKSATNLEIKDGTYYLRGNAGYIRYYPSSTQGSTIALYKKVPNVAVTGVSVSPTSVSLGVGATQQLTPTVVPDNATNKGVSYSSNALK